jgi:hypothetical protein
MLLAARGRTWEESTGSIKSVQEIGWQIWDANRKLPPCKICTPEAPEASQRDYSDSWVYDVASQICDYLDSGETDMSNCPIPALRWNNGILEVWHCCKWIPVPGEMLLKPVLPNPWTGADPSTGEPWEFSACGKAVAIVDAINAVVAGFWDARDAFPTQYLSTVSAYLPGYDLHNGWVVAGVLDAIKMAVADIVLDIDVATPVSSQSLVCKIATIMTDDSRPLSDAQYDQIKAFAQSEYGLWANIYLLAIAAIGKESLSDIAVLGAIDTDANCECPGSETGVIGPVTWSATPTVTSAAAGSTYTFLGRFNSGLSARHEWDTGPEDVFKAIELEHSLDIASGTEISEITVALVPFVPNDELLHNNWNPSEPCAGYDDVAVGIFDTVDRTEHRYTVQLGAVYVQERWSTPKTSLKYNTGYGYELRACPEKATNKVYRWQRVIVSINDVPTGILQLPEWPA